MKLEWETVVQTDPHDSTQRLQVTGGWLVCRINGLHLPKSVCSWYISDPDHNWNIAEGK